MTHTASTIDTKEVDKFAQLAGDWWDLNGPLRTLHDLNPARLDFISKHIQCEGLNSLDVGCGGGILAESLAKQGAHVVGLDAEQDAIQVAKDHAVLGQLKIDYICSPIEDFEHQGFDMVTCMELLEHVHRPELVMEHCARLLKPKGLLFVSTISRTLKAYATSIIAAEYILALLPRQTHDYEKFLKPSEISSMARTSGLSLIDLAGMSYNPLSRRAVLCTDVSVNYLMAFQKN